MCIAGPAGCSWMQRGYANAKLSQDRNRPLCSGLLQTSENNCWFHAVVGGSVMRVTYIRAFVPLKHPVCARRRMLEELTAKKRHSMYFTLARRIIIALRDAPLVLDTVNDTTSAEVQIFAGQLGLSVMHQ